MEPVVHAPDLVVHGLPLLPKRRRVNVVKRDIGQLPLQILTVYIEVVQGVVSPVVSGIHLVPEVIDHVLLGEEVTLMLLYGTVESIEITFQRSDVLSDGGSLFFEGTLNPGDLVMDGS